MQWAVGLELFSLIDDPSRVFFTTDHPNGAHFTAYPEIVALLMSKDLRMQWTAELPPAAMAVTTLRSITRKYTLPEIATMTRSAPARLLGLTDRGRLDPGAVADAVMTVIEGEAGACAGSRVTAGSLLVAKAGARPGYLMKRGSVVLGAGCETIAPAFVDRGYHELLAVRLWVGFVHPHSENAASLGACE